jgi:GNAT superfamily N-acetyltransferase
MLAHLKWLSSAWAPGLLGDAVLLDAVAAGGSATLATINVPSAKIAVGLMVHVPRITGRNSFTQVLAVVVHPEYRRCGVLSRLLDTLTGPLALYVDPINVVAISAYTAYGFQVASRTGWAWQTSPDAAQTLFSERDEFDVVMTKGSGTLIPALDRTRPANPLDTPATFLSVAAPVSRLPEHDASVLRTYHKLLASVGVDTDFLSDGVYATNSNGHVTFWHRGCWQAGPRSQVPLVPFLDNIVCCTVYNGSSADLANLVPLIASGARQLGAPLVIPEPMITRDTYTVSGPVTISGLIARENPYIDLSGLCTFEEYLGTLQKKRRYKCKQALDKASALTLTLGRSRVTTDLPKVMEWVATNFGDVSFGHMLWLYAASVERVRPDDTRTFDLRRPDGGLVAKATWILRIINGKGVWYLHCLAADPEQSDAGTAILALCVQDALLNGWGRYLDPTFGCSVHADAFSLYKRVVCNALTYVYTFCAGDSVSDVYSEPAYSLEAGWDTDKCLVVQGLSDKLLVTGSV